MNSIIRLMGICPRTPPLQPAATLRDLRAALLERGDADLILLPRLLFSPPSGKELSGSRTVRRACEEALDGLLALSREREGLFVLTALFYDSGFPREEAVVIRRGECRRTPADGEPLCCQIGELPFLVLPGAAESLLLQTGTILSSGCALVLNPAYEPAAAGTMNRRGRLLGALSDASGCAVFTVNGGVGDTSSPQLYTGSVALAENGALAAHQTAGLEPLAFSYDLDTDLLHPVSRAQPEPILIAPGAETDGLRRMVNRTPYLPASRRARRAFLEEAFRLQARALASRMQNTGIDRLVLGVSGGLDSTLALLVSAAACDLLSLPRGAVLAVTMPGFGTCGRTYENALQLMEALGAERREIPISQAVLSHFEDIGHDPAARDTTYENAQARERTQILFDLGNQEGALVVGTGDLSEAALGFATFGGDHLAGYNVNITLNKTTIRELTALIADRELLPGVAAILRDILDTPVSPELLPPDEEGMPGQKTEEILGPYILHDFFLYYTLKYSLTPAKVLSYAAVAFEGEFDPGFIKDKLRIFIKRFYQNQFKRSCAPDAAAVMEPNLIHYQIPSDLSAALFLEELEQITV
ncbi:MAG: NAD(+) synthase [Provencibacterium sp.]|jgi:NAD+ synthase (glutamine-hydrolysing)|nr:NAD(+) synthase [Provencibacterium sp.]